MKKDHWLNLLLGMWVAVLMAASYLLNAPQFSCWYNSDTGIHVLMANNFSWPEDLYYWGQDRLGSAVPLVGYCIHLLGVPTIISVGISKYLFLLIGYLVSSTFLTSRLSKAILALVWFYSLATYHNWTSLGHPYAENLAFVMMSFALTEAFFNRMGQNDKLNMVIVFCASVSWTLALWISDLTISLIPANLLHIWLHLTHHHGDKSIRKNVLLKLIRSGAPIAVGLGLALGAWFITFAKSSATEVAGYRVLFASASDLMNMFATMGKTIWLFLSFSKGTFVQSLAGCGIVLGIPVLIIGLIVSKQSKSAKPITRVLTLATLSMFAAVALSYWANHNDPILRYYAGIFPIGWLVALLTVERFRGLWRMCLFGFCLITGLLVAGSGFAHRSMRCDPVSPYKQASGIKNLGKASVVGDYWHSYILASTSPDSITATPIQGQYIRNKDLARKIASGKEIYLVKNRLFKEFPDSIVQFHYLFVRDGKPFTLANRSICKFRNVKKISKR